MMVGYPIERWSSSRHSAVIRWLTKTFGDEDPKVWYIDYDFDLQTLCLSDKVLPMALLKFKFLSSPA